ncbi:hypothetical protein B4U80_14333 [Leptotrombidium deliense]|uniref:Uncharacterized protein n=1 Tax=Leptotrombidium deliense TaxID=299467 RepID=A0A443RY00_9ACAR|nr:hypothetical protein B4U80_14333 [Leptotrombidium deliense]
MQLQTDVTFLCPSKAFAESFSEVNKVGQYFFLYKSKHDKIDCGPTHTCHMSDIAFTFAQFLSEEDREATLTWVNILSNFVKTGETIWTNYHRTSTSQLLPYYLEFNGTLTATSLKLGLKHIHCEIWKSMVLNDNKVLTDDTKFHYINEIEV